MSAQPRLLFFAGSARSLSHNKRLAQLGARIADANGIGATFADLADYPLPLYDGDMETAEGVPGNAQKLLALLAVHNGVFIASPEYNASVSPMLKNALDWMSRIRSEGSSGPDVFKSRVFAVGAASTSGTGGLRGLITLRHVLEIGLGALVLPDQLLVARAAGAFDEQGHLADKDAQERFKGIIQKLARAAHILNG